ncbi:LysR substrate-binding domain-containing protein [Pigmentiphaga sp. YJ18]|uniref:LysR family transcriptional regulator n=1 Tax=Pigmentiphaga sp. YJ18 TaxID=3134907 RepID=UPI0031131E25
MENADGIAAFLGVYEHGSLTAAAARLNRSLQSTSRSLLALERELGVELIHRTTRRCTPTEAGTAFYEKAKPAFEALRAAKLDAADRRVEPAGLLRIGASVQFAPAYLVPVVAAFMQRYPKVEVELALSDSFVDLIDANLDLALRIGELGDSGLRVRRLGALRRVVYGAPSYLDRAGTPGHPDELRQHACVLRTTSDADGRWPFLIDGKVRMVRVGGRFRANHTAAVTSAVAEGVGLGFAPIWQLRDLIAAGSVRPLLESYEVPPVPIHAVWSGGLRAPAKTRRFIEFLGADLKRHLP